MSENELDLRELAADAALSTVLEAFAALPPGGSVVLVGAGSPRALARGLIQAHWGLFDWAPLRAGNPDWLTRLTRREAPAPEQLTAFLAADHARCDTLLAQAENAAQEGDLPRARTLVEAYTVGMRRHFEMEEQGYFGEFEARMGMPGGGPTAVMREEHTQIRGLLTQLEATMAAGDLEALLATSETLVILMEQHNVKEEQMLYPMADELFAGEVGQLLKNLILF